MNAEYFTTVKVQ